MLKINLFYSQSDSVKKLLILAFFVSFLDLSSAFTYSSAECEDVYALPKIFGKNNSANDTYAYFMAYNQEADRTTVSVRSNDTILCQGTS